MAGRSQMGVGKGCNVLAGVSWEANVWLAGEPSASMGGGWCVCVCRPDGTL